MKTIFLFTLLSIYCSLELFAADKNRSSDKIEYFAMVPNEVLKQIITHAYINYDDPVEFTRLKSVCTEWHTIINSEPFKKNAKKLGFMEPMMIFRKLSANEQKQSDFLEKDIVADAQGDMCNSAWKVCKNTVQFRYIDSKKMQIPETFNGIFYYEGYQYCALWVNPKKTYVFNGDWTTQESLAKSFHQSKMSLVEYTKLLTWSNANMKSIGYSEMHNPLVNTNIIYIPAPIAQSRLVKKWPSTYTFEKVEIVSSIGG